MQGGFPMYAEAVRKHNTAGVDAGKVAPSHDLDTSIATNFCAAKSTREDLFGETQKLLHVSNSM